MMKGKYKRTQEIRKKISDSLKGRKLSKSVRIKISKSLKRRYKEGTFTGSRGKSHSEETKKKLRISQLGKKHKSMSEEGKKNISNALIGRKQSKETCIKMGKSKCGENNPNWKGGISRNKQSPNEPKYKKWRLSVFIRDNYTCTNCKERGCYLEAHHIKSWAKYPLLRYDINNGSTLCEECHSKTENYKGKKSEN